MRRGDVVVSNYIPEKWNSVQIIGSINGLAPDFPFGEMSESLDYYASVLSL